MLPPVISIISKKNSGKTTLLEKLIPELKARGYRIGTLKHDTHGFEIDHKGKDTWRHKQAGAETVAISSPWKISVIKDVAEELDIDQIVSQYFSDVDIVITEGYKRASKPQIEVFRSAAHSSPLHTRDKKGYLTAVVSDINVDLGVPCFNINDVVSIADFIENNFIKKF
jgi:molybdopterin-guanine dinucleotide biosynthesis protein B